MRHSRVICGFGGSIALLCATAVGHAYYPTAPTPEVACTRQAACATLAPVNELLDKLEALKAKREAIQREEKAPLAALKEQLARQQERLSKLGIAPAAPSLPTIYSPPPATVESSALRCYEPVTTYTENSYYEPVTNCTTTRVFDKQTNSYKNETACVTSYVLRKVKVPVTTYRQRGAVTRPTPSCPACVPVAVPQNKIEPMPAPQPVGAS